MKAAELPNLLHRKETECARDKTAGAPHTSGRTLVDTDSSLLTMHANRLNYYKSTLILQCLSTVYTIN